MTSRQRRGLACATLFAVASVVASAAKAGAPQGAAASAAAASPALVGALSKEIGSTPEQAAGAAGALFGVAKSRLKPAEFSQVASAVPGMSSLLNAAPAAGTTGTSGAMGALSKVTKSAGGLASATSAFNQLGLKPELVTKAIPVLTTFVTKSGGANVGNLLAGALKECRRPAVQRRPPAARLCRSNVGRRRTRVHPTDHRARVLAGRRASRSDRNVTAAAV